MLEVSWMLHHKLPEDKIEDMQVWLYGREAGLHWPNCEIIKNDINSQTHITKKIEGNLLLNLMPKNVSSLQSLLQTINQLLFRLNTLYK